MKMRVSRPAHRLLLLLPGGEIRQPSTGLPAEGFPVPAFQAARVKAQSAVHIKDLAQRRRRREGLFQALLPVAQRFVGLAAKVDSSQSFVN